MCVCVWCEEMLTNVEDVDKSEALRLRPCQYIYMEGRTPYTTGVPLIPLLVRRYVSGIS